jgi:hypothetical protein
MKNTKSKINSALTRNQIISSVVWALVILACSFSMGSSHKEILYILIAGSFIEFLRISSFNKTVRKDNSLEIK